MKITKTLNTIPRVSFLGLFFGLSFLHGAIAAEIKDPQPNVLIILADDLGYGDVGAFGAELIATPNIDRLAREGLRFTQAYTPCSVCSPTRYGLLTGRYAWRRTQHPETKVIQDGQGLCIEDGRETLATLFKKKGYATGIIGKWHLGFGKFKSFDQQYDWSQDKPIGPGPLQVGFDSYFGMAANVGNQPRFFIENDDFAGRKPGDKITMKGLEAIPWDSSVFWNNEEVSQIIADKAVEFIHSHSGADKPPFFLYFAANIPHGPITPSHRFQGSSQCGPYGDFIQELDTQIGQILDAVEAARPYRNTLVIFTSDNGGVATAPDSRGPASGSPKQAQEAGHLICGPFRGGKWSIYEGGFRVPFIVHWPSRIAGGQSSDAMISLVDIFATLADLLEVHYGQEAGEDSFSFWRQLQQGPDAPANRDHVIVQSPLGVRAVVHDGWKLIRPWQAPKQLSAKRREWLLRELDNPENHPQLYHLAVDIAERMNRLNLYPEVAEQLKAKLQDAVTSGRSQH